MFKKIYYFLKGYRKNTILRDVADGRRINWTKSIWVDRKSHIWEPRIKKTVKMKFTKLNEKEEAISEFEDMTEMAELKALSRHSLENQLTDKQYERMMELKKKLMDGKIEE